MLLNGSRSILSRVGTIMDGTNDEKSPGKPRTLSGTRARPRVSATGGQEFVSLDRAIVENLAAGARAKSREMRVCACSKSLGEAQQPQTLLELTF